MASPGLHEEDDRSEFWAKATGAERMAALLETGRTRKEDGGWNGDFAAFVDLIRNRRASERAKTGWMRRSWAELRGRGIDRERVALQPWIMGETLDGDGRWMRRALELGRRGLGLTAPNPPVGCVLVADGEEIGSGWHRRDGAAHAEAEALADAVARGNRERLRGATAFVTLEPCSSAGRTGACTAALIEAGVGRVVWAVEDPQPAHRGRARAALEAAGIAVGCGVCEDHGRELLAGYLSVLERGRPWVVLKSAQSLDGRVVRRPGESRWLSGPQSRHRAQQLRAEVEAIVIGGSTLREDDPELTLRTPHPHGHKPQPWRVVLTRGGALPERAKLFTDGWRERTLMVRFGEDTLDRPRAPQGVATLDCESLEEFLGRLAQEFGVARVLVEGGGLLAGAMIAANLVDEWQIFQTGWAVGAGTASVEADWPASREWSLVSCERLGDDLLSRWRPRRESRRPAVFFDRDGVVNDNSNHYYILRQKDFVFCHGIVEALRVARDRDYRLVLVTSQKAVGKGLLSTTELETIHARMQEKLAAQGVAFERIEAFTGADDQEPRAKPNPVMVFEAAEALDIDLERSWVVGDSDRDIEMGRRAGCRTLRVGGDPGAEPRADAWVASPAELAGKLGELLDDKKNG